jgi:hypothetical protein
MSEIEAMSGIDQALGALEPDEQKRVLRWAIDKFGGGEVKLGMTAAGRSSIGTVDGSGTGTGNGSGEYARIADLMDAASPATVVDHVLVASYWFQVVKGQENFTGQEVNSELKDLGHGASNITDSYNSLIKRRPPAVRQVQKSGTTKQARKRYRLTEVGVRTVDRMISGGGEGEE